MRLDHERILTQIINAQELDEAEIIRDNYMHVTLEDIKLILQTLISMKAISLTVQANGKRIYRSVNLQEDPNAE